MKKLWRSPLREQIFFLRHQAVYAVSKSPCVSYREPFFYQNKEHFIRITEWLIKILIFSFIAKCLGYTDAKLCRGVLKDFVTIEVKNELIWMEKLKKQVSSWRPWEPNKLCDIQPGCFQLYPNVKAEQDTAGRHCSLDESEFHLIFFKPSAL